MRRWPLLLLAATALAHAQAPTVLSGKLTPPDGGTASDYRILALTDPVAEKPFDNDGVKVSEAGGAPA